MTMTIHGTQAQCSTYINALLSTWNKVAITGGPGLGKSTVVQLALIEYHLQQGVTRHEVLATDKFKAALWEEQCKLTLEWSTLYPRWVMEGITVARALRHGLDPDVVLVLHGKPHRPLSDRARRLAKTVDKWVDEAASLNPGLLIRHWEFPDLTESGPLPPGVA